MKNANENFKMIKKHFTVLKIGFKSNADKMPLNSFYVILKHFEKMQGFKCFSYDFKKLHLTEDFIKSAVRISGLTFDLYLDDVTGFLDGRDGPGWNHLTENKKFRVLCCAVRACVCVCVGCCQWTHYAFLHHLLQLRSSHFGLLQKRKKVCKQGQDSRDGSE